MQRLVRNLNQEGTAQSKPDKKRVVRRYLARRYENGISRSYMYEQIEYQADKHNKYPCHKAIINMSPTDMLLNNVAKLD